MAAFSTGTTSIPYGTTLRIGFRPQGSTSAFTYPTPYKSYDDLPATITVPAAGTYEVEYTIICPNCSLGTYSSPIQTIVTTT